MSLLSKYVQKEELLKQLQAELAQLEQNEKLKAELQFKEKLEALMKEYEKSATDVIELLRPSSSGAATTSAGSDSPKGRRRRKTKVYKNPKTGEVIETRGGNHKTLKAWKAEHGSDTVESWVVEEKE